MAQSMHRIKAILQFCKAGMQRSGADSFMKTDAPSCHWLPSWTKFSRGDYRIDAVFRPSFKPFSRRARIFAETTRSGSSAIPSFQSMLNDAVASK